MLQNSFICDAVTSILELLSSDDAKIRRFLVAFSHVFIVFLLCTSSCGGLRKVQINKTVNNIKTFALFSRNPEQLRKGNKKMMNRVLAQIIIGYLKISKNRIYFTPQ